MAQASGIPSSGNIVLDHQHGRLGRLLQIAALAARDIADGELFHQTLADFRHYLAHHFSVETVIIRGAGFDAVHNHGRAHTAILERVDTALAQLDEVLSVPERHRRLDELETMLVEHEMLEDAAFWDTLRAHAGQPVLQWTALMTTGINWLDDQHREMVAQLNGLAKAAQDGRHEEAGQRLRRFLDMARAHFADEERQLAEWGEAMPEHRAEHARMLEELDSLVNDGDDPGILVNHYLRFWMIDHILGLDRRDLAGRS